jgi:hypothetical protein
MFCEELRVQQREAPGFKPRHKMDKGDLARIAFARKHAFAEKGGAETDAIQASDKPPVAPALHAVRMANAIKLGIQRNDFGVYPAFFAIRRSLRAGCDDLVECGVDADGESIAAHGARETARHMEGFERNDSPFLRGYEIEFPVVAAPRHRENPVSIGPEQQIDVQI